MWKIVVLKLKKLKKIPIVLFLILILIFFNFSELKAVFFSLGDVTIEDGVLQKLLEKKFDKRDYKEGEVLIKFKKSKIDLSTKEGESIAEGFSSSKFLRIKRIFPEYNFALLTIENGKKVKEIIEELKDDPNVEFIQPNYIYRLQATFPNDPEFDKLWGLHNIGQIVNNVTGTVDADIDAPEAWDIATSSDIIVAVIDTGVDYNHPDLIDNIWRNEAECTGIPSKDDDENGYIDDCLGANFASPYWCFGGYNGNDPMDDHGHGTHVAGIIAAVGNNAIGTVGVSWKVKIMAVKFLDCVGWGTSEGAILSIEYAIKNGAKILNCSWGGYRFDEALFEVMKKAKEKGVLIVAAAGNESNNNDAKLSLFPASFRLSNIISVAASQQKDALTTWSNYGKLSVDVAAPGDNILSTVPQLKGAVFASTTNYKVVYFSFGFEGINDNTGYSTRAEVMKRVLDWLGAATSSPILLVDGDRCAIEYYPFPRYDIRCDLQSFYINALNAGGYYNVTVWDIEKRQISPSFEDMAGKYVIWFTGFEPLYPSESAELAKFLDNGGRLFLTGQNIASLGDREFCENYLHARFLRYMNEGGQFYQGFEIFDGITVDLRREIGGDGANNQLFIDVIEPISAGIAGFQNKETAYFDGTSMAAPHVSGLAALIWSKNPDLDYLQVKNLILASGDNRELKISTKKRINAYKALTFDTATLNPSGEIVGIKQKELFEFEEGVACGEIKIEFIARDTQPGLSVRLEDFQYSVDGGLTWKAVPSTSTALAVDWKGGGDWRDNDYMTLTEWKWHSHHFWFLTLEEDVKADFENQDQNDVKIRFRVNNGFKTSDYITSENFRVDNLAPEKPTITNPATTSIIVNTFSYTITGTTSEPDVYIFVYQNNELIRKHPLFGTTTFSITVDLLPNTSNQFKITAVDNFGNESEPVILEIVQDSLSPITYVLDIEGDNSPPYFVNTTTPRVTLSINEGGKCRWSTIDTDYSSMPPENECEVTSTTVTCKLTNIGEDGKKVFYVRCIDAIDNAQEHSTLIEFTLDTTKPKILFATVFPTSVDLGEEIEIQIAFVDAGIGIDTTFDPLVKIANLRKEYLVKKVSAEIIKTDDTVIWLWKGKFTVPTDEATDVNANIFVSQVKDLLGNVMEPSEKAGSFYIKPKPPVREGISFIPLLPTPAPKLKEKIEEKIEKIEEKIGKAIVTPQKEEKVIAVSPEKITAEANIPAKAVEKEIEIKIIPIAKEKAKVGPPPAGTFLIGNYVFDFSATINGQPIIFVKPVEVVFIYNDEQIKGLDEKTLAIYYWKADVSQWEPLLSSVDIIKNTVTATTTQFFHFALIGKKEVDKPVIEGIPAGFKFTRPLRIGNRGVEVRYLQLFLKAQGPEIYPEQLVTGYFGPLTLRAVCRFQLREGILPSPTHRLCGYVGPLTRAKINELLYKK